LLLHHIVMKRALLSILVLCASCDNVSLPPAVSMPWVHGFNAIAVGDTPTSKDAQRISNLLNVPAEDAYGGIELRADIAGDSTRETVLVSYRLGVVAVDPAGRMIASTPGLDFSGSADEVISVAIGDGQLGAPMIIVAVQSGGHRESTISLTIYRLYRGKVLEQLFSAPIEEHAGAETAAGSLTFTPSGLVYRAPRARSATPWRFDVQRRRYIEQGIITPDVVPSAVAPAAPIT
jgi:hypothetical protein